MAFPDTLSDIGVVRISDTAPVVGIDGDLWYSPLTGTLSISGNGAWLSVGGGGTAALPEVHVGPNRPVMPNVLVWIDTSQPELDVQYRTGGGWETGLNGGRY